MQEKIKEMARAIDELLVENPKETTKHAMNVATYLFDRGYRKQEWISVEDRLPEEREHVIVFCEDGLVGEAWHKKEGLFWWMDDRDGIAEATRYCMPLPEPPKKGGE
jgi:hypothetical protein